MSYKHGAYGQIVENTVPEAAAVENAPIYIGTAPVHQTIGGASRVNKPTVVMNMADAIRLFGYSDNWAAYTLCEAFYAHFQLKGVGPIIVINVLSPVTHKATTGGTASKTPVNGRIVIENATDIILGSVEVKTTGTEPVTKVKDQDYTIVFDAILQRLVITSIGDGLGTSALNITYDKVDPTKVTTAEVIGGSDGEGTNTGVSAVKDVYQLCRMVPQRILAPGFSSEPTVRAAMVANSANINGHFDAIIYTDIPIVSGGNPVTMTGARTWQSTNNYLGDNEKVFFPLWKATDGRIYHLSTLFAANLQAIEQLNDGIPYHTASNTPIPVAGAPYFGESKPGLVIDDELANNTLNANGITTVVFANGWVLWGAHMASYAQGSQDAMNVADTNLGMLQYITNNFQIRRMADVDAPMSVNRMHQIVAEEQDVLDGYLSIGALLYGTVRMDGATSESDIANGDFKFRFDVTTTPLTKSLTAYVGYTPQGLSAFFTAEEE